MATKLGATGGANAFRTASGASIISAATYISLHTADPTYTGLVGEASGGSPAYARKAVAWNAPTFSAGTETITNSGAITFDVPAGTYTFWGIWDALAGNFLMGGTCTSQVFSAQGQYQIAAAALTITAVTA